MASRRIAQGLVAACITVLVAGQSSAGSPGTWTRIGPQDNPNTAEVGMARTSDGVLHVVWQEDPAGGTADASVHHATVQPNGTVSAPNTIVQGWGFINNHPDLILATDGTLQAFWGGVESSIFGLHRSVSTDGGTTWSAPEHVAKPTGGAFGEAAVTQAADGTFFEASSAIVHRGLDPNSQNYDFGAPFPGASSYNSDIATDLVTGEVWHAWYMASSGETTGIYAQQADLTSGAPVGSAMQMPGSATTYNGAPTSINNLKRNQLAARPQGGVYIVYGAGYPSVDKVLLWEVGAPSSVNVGSSPTMNGNVGLAAVPDGRLWVLWLDTSAEFPRVFAKVSNDTLTSWSPAVTVTVPKDPSGYVASYGIQANAQASGKLDIFVNVSAQGEGLFHSQIAAPPEWTAGNDSLTGTAGADFLYGGAGDDKLSSGGGKDKVYGGDGADRLDGGAGVDVLNGGKGKDLCFITKGDKTTSCEATRRRGHT